METFDYFSTIESVKESMLNDIRNIVKSHGGRYEWPKNEGPYITAVTDDLVERFSVSAVALQEEDSLEIEGYWISKAQNGTHEFLWIEDDVPVEDIMLILEFLQIPS